MATTDFKPPGRKELANFIKDPETLRKFEKLFASAQTAISQIQAVADLVNVLLLGPVQDFGTAAFRNFSSSGDADNLEVVLGNDTRLVNGRPPSGAAGGVLAGTYPDPDFAPNVSIFTATLGGSGSATPIDCDAYLIKIGNLRSFFIDYDFPLSSGAGSGLLQLYIDGLPEAADKNCSGAVGLYLNAPVSRWSIPAGDNKIYLFGDSGGGTVSVTGVNIIGDFNVGIAGSYFV